jgi:hypothetical protein
VRTRCAGLLLLGLLIGSGCGADPSGEAGGLQKFEGFDAFPLYAPGDSFGDFELEVVRRRPGYVEFRYASEPPLRVEVWPGCVRTPWLREGVLVEGEPYERTIVVREATAYAFDGGRRLEVPLEGATVVVWAHRHRVAREAARALEGVNNSLTREDPLPGVDPDQTPAGCSVFDPEAALIEARLEEALGLQGPHLLRCGRSLSVARTDGVDDAHDCFSGTAGGEPSFWCVLSRGNELVAGAMAQSCEAAVQAGSVATALSETATLGWGALADGLCEPHLARVPEVVAGMATERAVHDLSYVWEVMGAYEADLVAELRSVSAPSLEVEAVLALYEARIAAIRAAVDRYHAGQRRKALADLSRIEGETAELVKRFETLGAPQCAPPW